MLPGRKYTPEDIVAIVWHRKWLLVAGMLVCTSIAVAVSMRLPNRYRSETLILVIPQRIPESYVRSTVTMRIEDRLRSIEQEILSRSRLERVIAEFDLYAEERKQQPMEVVIEKMRSNVTVDTVRDDAFKVSFTSTVPRTAMIVTERLASMFIDENSKDRSVMAEGTNQFLESQLVDARAQLQDHEKKLEAFRRRNSGELPSQLQTNLQVIQGNQSQIQSLNESINRDRDRRLVLEKQVADALAAPVDGTASADAPAAGPVDQLAKAREELHVLELRLKPEHPDVVAKKRSIADLERAVEQQAAGADPGDQQPAAKPASAAEAVRQARARQFQIEMAKVDRQIASKEADVARLRQAVSDTQRRVDAVPGHESELTDLMRDYETLQKTYSTLLAKKEDSKISANLERQQVSEQFKILDRARLPEKPSSPNRLYIALGAAAFGLALAIGLAGFLEYRDTTLRTEDEILRTLVLPVIAVIPMMHAAADIRRRRRKEIVTAALAAFATVGVVAATLWRLGLLKGIR